MNIEKERELFEAWVIENLADGRSMSWEDWCWKSWQAAKAQAVQEGFVLVPKEMPKSFDEGLYVYSNSISIVDECSEGFIPMSDINHAEVWKLVIEAQEQSK